MKKEHAVSAIWILAVCSLQHARSAEITIPTVYEAGHFFAVPVTAQGQTLRFVVDTGGGGGSGMILITPEAVKRIHAPTYRCDDIATGSMIMKWPEFMDAARLPHPPLQTPCKAMALVIPIKTGRFVEEGIIGGGYLPQFRAWHFNYPDRRLSIEDDDWKIPSGKTVIPLGFPKNAQGIHTGSFPSVEMQVDGHATAMLLDTGATAMQTPAGLKATGAPQVRGQGTTSYITTSVMNAWHKMHPDWPIVVNGDSVMPARLIEVPQIKFGPYVISHVWFTERPDKNFGMHGVGQYMDREIQGALGANVLSHFDMVIDYRHDCLVLLSKPV
ncbi:hypothetical protein HW537_08980 [Asaia siamensis]